MFFNPLHPEPKTYYFLTNKEVIKIVKYTINIVTKKLKLNVKNQRTNLINGNQSCADIGINDIIPLTTKLPTL
jgi:hypothetical protein